MHLYDSRFSAVAGASLTPPDAGVEAYRAMQARLSLGRVVVVQPSTYGIDPSYLPWALAELGPAARGIAVVDTRVSDAALRELHACGVRGLRFNQTLGHSTPIKTLEPLAERIAPLGWHLEFLLPSNDLLPLEARLRALPVPIVFDHMGRLPTDGLQHPGFAAIERLLSTDRAWVKLSGAYLAHAPQDGDYPTADSLARRLLGLAPHRMVWGSNWPHPTASAGLHPMPDDRGLLDLLARWTDGNEALIHRVLVTNPETLYDLPSSVR